MRTRGHNGHLRVRLGRLYDTFGALGIFLFVYTRTRNDCVGDSFRRNAEGVNSIRCTNGRSFRSYTPGGDVRTCLDFHYCLSSGPFDYATHGFGWVFGKRDFFLPDEHCDLRRRLARGKHFSQILYVTCYYSRSLIPRQRVLRSQRPMHSSVRFRDPSVLSWVRLSICDEGRLDSCTSVPLGVDEYATEMPLLTGRQAHGARCANARNANGTPC